MTTKISSSAEWQWGGGPRRPASSWIQFRPLRAEPAPAPSSARGAALLGLRRADAADVVASGARARGARGRRRLPRGRRGCGPGETSSVTPMRATFARGRYGQRRVGALGRRRARRGRSAPPIIVCVSSATRCTTQSPASTSYTSPSCQDEAGAGEHVEDLLLVELDVDRRRLLALGSRSCACDTDVLRAGRGCRGRYSGEAERALVDDLGFDVVPVRDHVGDRTRLTSRGGPIRTAVETARTFDQFFGLPADDAAALSAAHTSLMPLSADSGELSGGSDLPRLGGSGFVGLPAEPSQGVPSDRPGSRSPGRSEASLLPSGPPPFHSSSSPSQ